MQHDIFQGVDMNMWDERHGIGKGGGGQATFSQAILTAPPSHSNIFPESREYCFLLAGSAPRTVPAASGVAAAASESSLPAPPLFDKPFSTGFISPSPLLLSASNVSSFPLPLPLPMLKIFCFCSMGMADGWSDPVMFIVAFMLVFRPQKPPCGSCSAVPWSRLLIRNP